MTTLTRASAGPTGRPAPRFGDRATVQSYEEQVCRSEHLRQGGQVGLVPGAVAGAGGAVVVRDQPGTPSCTTSMVVATKPPVTAPSFEAPSFQRSRAIGQPWLGLPDGPTKVG